MEVSGKIIFKLPLQEGVSKAGRNWKKQEYVLETHDSFPKKVKFDFFGDRADQYQLEIGDEVTVSFDIESREFNGRWYTDIHGWKADKGQAPAVQMPPVDAVQGAPVSDPFGAPAPATFSPAPDNAQDDLPF